MSSPMGVPTGSVFRREGVRRPVWYAKYRLPDGRQVQKKIGPAWTERGRPAAGYFTKRTAEAWLRDALDQARRGTLPGMVRTGVTFADAAAEWLRFIEEDRERQPSTLVDYRSAIRGSPLARGERPPMRPSGDIQVFSPEEVWALVRAAASEMDGAIFLTAAFTGLRMGELRSEEHTSE